MKTIKELLGLPEAKKMKGEDPCWKGYEMVGTKKKNGKEVPNCVPKNEEVEIYEAKVGDTVSFHHELKAAPGTKVKKSGTVEKIENDTVHVKVKDRYGVKRHQVKMSDLVKEEVEQVDELNKDTVYSYNKKSTAETDKLHKKLGELIRSNKPAEANKTAHKLNKRVAGQERADARLNTEEKDLDQLFTEAMKKGGEETSTKKVIKKGQELSGKQEPVKINPEIQRNQIGR